MDLITLERIKCSGHCPRYVLDVFNEEWNEFVSNGRACNVLSTTDLDWSINEYRTNVHAFGHCWRLVIKRLNSRNVKEKMSMDSGQKWCKTISLASRVMQTITWYTTTTIPLGIIS